MPNACVLERLRFWDLRNELKSLSRRRDLYVLSLGKQELLQKLVDQVRVERGIAECRRSGRVRVVALASRRDIPTQWHVADGMLALPRVADRRAPTEREVVYRGLGLRRPTGDKLSQS